MPRATSYNNSRNDVRSDTRNDVRTDTRNDARSDIRNDSRTAPRPAAPDPRERHEHFPADPARQARAKLLRDFEQTTLTASNFCVLKRLTPADLQAQLTQARSERGPLPGPGRKHPPGQPQP